MNEEEAENQFNLLGHELEHFEKKIFDQKELITISKALNSELNINTLIERILDISLTQGQTFKIGLFLQENEDNNTFYLQDNFVGFEIDDISQFTIEYDNIIINKLLEQDKRGLCLDELEEKIGSNRKGKKIIQQLKTLGDTLLVIPFKNKSLINAIIVMGDKHNTEQYSLSEKEFLFDLASIASIAIENAKLYQLATVDMMTQLKMHHFFQMKLKEEFKQSSQEKRPLSILFTDIDHFKNFNDTYGHQLGDLVLKAVAQILLLNSRNHDIAARYGGEEFAIVLPQTPLNEAKDIAEKIRQDIEDLEVDNPTDVGDDKLKVTISIGVAEYDSNQDSCAAELIKRSDDAVYRAKESGRNCVVTSLGGQKKKPSKSKKNKKK